MTAGDDAAHVPLANARAGGDTGVMRFGLAAVTFAAVALATGGADAGSDRRLPAGYHRGRCLYVVGGKTRIAGPCFYRIGRGGGFGIDGPRQVYGGVDTVDRGASALTYSRDWWAEVWPEGGGWSGYGNEGVGDVHGGSPWTLRRRGACYAGDDVRICLWRA